jgi:hypothetical protein
MGWFGVDINRADMENQVIVAKFFYLFGAGTWWLMNWGIVQLFETEVGSFSKSELENYVGKYGLGIDRNLYF